MANLVRHAPGFERDLGTHASESDARRGRIRLLEDALYEVARGVECDSELGPAALERIANRATEPLIQGPKELDFTIDAKRRIPYLHTL